LSVVIAQNAPNPVKNTDAVSPEQRLLLNSRSACEPRIPHAPPSIVV